MENNHRFERKNRGNRMSELAKDEGKMVDDEIFKEDSSDDDFNPEDVKNVVNSSSAEENEEIEDEEGEGEGGEEDDSNEENESEEEEEIRPKSPKKKKKKEEEILDIDQLDIDKIDMIEDLKDRGIDIDVSDEEELEKRMREYNEESENEEFEEKKEEKKAIEVVKKKRGRKSKKELEMMRKKRGRKKKIIEKDDNIFLSNQPQANIEVNNNKIIIENIENNIELEEEEKKEPNIQSGKSSKIKKSKKDKINRDLGINPDQFLSNYNPNIISEDNFILTVSKNCLTESIPEIQYSPSAPPANLDYIELNNYLETPSSPSKLRKKQKNKLMTKTDEKNATNSNYNNSGIIEINNNNIIINKKYKNKSNEINFNEELNTDQNINNNTNDIIGHKRTRYDNNLIDLFKKQKKEKPNKNVTIVGNRENPKYIYISKKIFDENDEEKEIRKEEKKKKKKEKEKEEDKEKEKERINFDLEQELDAKNIIMKFKQQEKEKKQFGLQNKYISQEQRLLESIFTELTNKQSLKTMQKLEDLNKRENYLYTNKKTFKDYIKITNSERHILEDKDKNKIEKDNISINNNISPNNININTNEIKNEEKKDLLNVENENKDNKEIKSKINSNIDDNNNIDSDMKKTMEEEYKEKEKKLNKVRVTFTNKEYFRIFNNLNKKPIKDKKEKICVITGKPAKYFDPLTKNYYSTVEAFKILRERYYQNEEDRLLFKIQTLSDLASQKKERLKKMIMSENEKPKEQIDYTLNNNETHKNNSIKIDSETMSIEENNENNSNKASRFLSGNSALMKMINKFGLLKNDGGNEDKKVISHRIYNRNRENCVDSGMLLEANKVKLIISKKIFKDKYSSKLPAPEMPSE